MDLPERSGHVLRIRSDQRGTLLCFQKTGGPYSMNSMRVRLRYGPE